jgi:hypothetical protein
MSKRKRANTPARVTPIPAIGSPDHYQYFLNNNIPKRVPAKLGAAAVRGWQQNTGVRGQIENEIAQKFNLNNTLGGISKVKYGPVGGDYAYFTDKKGSPQLNLAPLPGGKMTDGANATRVAHELMHANDHQVDQLNPKVWSHLGALANTGQGATITGNGVPMADFTNFQQSIARIQDKIDPLKDFSRAYNKDYNQKQLQLDMRDARGLKNYTIPNTSSRNPDWLKLSSDIQATLLPAGTPAGQLPNPLYKLPQGSEYPAYLSERLERPLDTSDRNGVATAAPGANALSLPEARFLYSTLGDMSTAYPATDPTTGNPAYPTMNQHIGARRNSIADAYYPPQPGGTPGSGVPATGFSKGGKIKAKSKKRGLFSYFKG